MRNKIRKFLKIISIVFGIIFFGFYLHAANAQASFDSGQKNVELNDGGTIFELTTSAQTVDEFLRAEKISLVAQDTVLPARETKIYSGSNIIILRAKKVIIKDGGEKQQIFTQQNNVAQVIWENKNIQLDEDDIVQPGRLAPVVDGMLITITHVLIKEETIEQPIDFKTVANEDDSLSWRIKKTTQKGVKGVKEINYKVVYNDGKEISRKVLQSRVTSDPVDEIVTQGTFVKVGKASTGQASWYAFTGQLCAANPWLPLGSYAKVTNQDNGKTVIVKINDRGPFGKGRIIDLDKVAFAKIADLGSGIANVKMEPITN